MIIVYGVNLPGYRILFTAHALVSQSQLSLDTHLHFGIPSSLLAFCRNFSTNSHILPT